MAPNAEKGLHFVRNLPPGRIIAMILCAYEMYPYDGTWFLKQLRKRSLLVPPCYFLTSNDINSKLHKPAGSEKIIHLLSLEQHDLLLMIVRHCASKIRKPKNKLNLHKLEEKQLEDHQRQESDDVHKNKNKGKRIGNGGIAYKPSKPRDPSQFAYASLNRWKGNFSEVTPETVTRVLEQNGAEQPRVIPVNSPRFQKSQRRPSWYNKEHDNKRNHDLSKGKSGRNRRSRRTVLQNAGATAALKSPRLVHGIDLNVHLDKLVETGRRGWQMARGKGTYLPQTSSLSVDQRNEQAEDTAKMNENRSVEFESSVPRLTLVSPRPSIADLAQHTPRNKF